MGLFSFASKNKEEAASADGEFYSRAEDESQLTGGRSRKPRKPSKPKTSNAPIDPVLPEKKRARRRLIGAVALVLAMIIGLPMLLDSEPKSVSDDIAIQIPSKDKPGALPVATPVAAPVAPSAAAASQSTPASVPLAASLGQQEQIVNLPPATAGNSKPAVPNVATPARMPAPVTPAVISPAPAPAVSPTTSAAASKPKSKDDAKPEIKVAEAKPQAKMEHDDARAEAILEGKDNDAKANGDKKPGKFIVQVAALASQEKVDELQGKLNEAGIKSYVQKVATDSGERVMRVRVGPFASKEEAESARVKLGKLGLNGKLLPSS
jgi:DedD protein